MEGLVLVLGIVAAVLLAWVGTRKSSSAKAEGKLEWLAGQVGGKAVEGSVMLQFEGMPAEGAMEEDRELGREGANVQLHRRYRWKVRLVTPAGPRVAYHPASAADDLPDGPTFLQQLRNLHEKGQG